MNRAHNRTSGATLTALVGVALVVGGSAPVRSATGPGTSPPVRLHAAGPPAGKTGGFGEATCQECHIGAELNVEGRLSLDGLPDSYEPGATYVVTVVLRSIEMVRAGFQATARYAEGSRSGTQAGSLTTLGPRTALSTDSVSGLRFVQHAAGSVEALDPDLVSWTFEWTAPPSGGTVLFHASANSANGDDSPLGDLVYTAEARVPASGTRLQADRFLLRP